MAGALHILRVAKCLIGLVWGLSVVTMGLHLGLHVSAVLGLGVTAMGHYVLMYLVLDEVVRPVKRDVTAFLKLTAAMIVAMAGAFVIWDRQGILWAVTQALQH